MTTVVAGEKSATRRGVPRLLLRETRIGYIFREMKAFGRYVTVLRRLLVATARLSITPRHSAAVASVLDGQPSDELRRCVPTVELRSAGAFFTGSAIAQRAIAAGFPRADKSAVAFDPTCGAGDLLVAFTRTLPAKSDPLSTLDAWKDKILGRDIHSQFVKAAKLRLALLAVQSAPASKNFELPKVGELFEEIKTGSSLTNKKTYKAATHILINPPFTLANAPPDCCWASGKVNSAALFLDVCAKRCEPGTKIIAILPEVLRGGSRYERWRKEFERRVQLLRFESVGRFGPHADVDVFIAVGIVKRITTPAASANWTPRRPSKSKRIIDQFDIRVGPVVQYRDPHRGPWFPFAQAREMPAWESVADVARYRRFAGTVFKPPFVVVRRTSRPGDKHRAVGTIIRGARLTAVENHLIVVRPRDSTLRSCRKLLTLLRENKTSAVLNHRLRCRHLTVSSVGDLEWRKSL
jgi:hypothetical protein